MNKKRRGIPVIALILTLCAASGIIIGCSIEKQSTVTGKFGFVIPLPAGFNNKVAAESDENRDNEIVSFYHIPTRGHPEYGGENGALLFTILRLTADRLVPEEFQPANDRFFAQGDGWYYVISKPTDVQYVPTDQALSAEYFMLQDKSAEIAQNFIKANDLEPFTSDGVDEAKGFVRNSIKTGTSGFYIKPAAGEIKLDISLPKGWEVSHFDPGISINENGKAIAEISFNGFELYPDVPEDRFYHMVYSDFMNGSMADWDSGYKPGWNQGTTVSATDKVSVSTPPAQGSTERDTYSFFAVLAYDTELLAYVVISFDRDYPVSEETLAYIARSIKLSPAPAAAETDDFSDLDNLVELFVTPVYAGERADKTGDTELLALFEKSLYPNSVIICDLYMNGTGLDFDYDIKHITDDNRADYTLVKNIENIETLKNNLKAVFSENRLDSSVYPVFFEGELPLFVENGGKLYYNRNTGGARAYSPDYAKAAVLSKSAERFTVELPMTALDDPNGTPFIYSIVKQNGMWVFDRNFWFDYEP